ncbi:SGNH/GDSL hydrolase family protein [Tenacibaculum aestuariivivum]|uniref:SGNH/GDSL hydrolase family protein n=1 Tax=Tenacibaculum aestuariivivum TaxID=2006131 RepID=UPI003AB23443
MKNILKYTFLSALFLGFAACDVDNTLPEIKGDAENRIALEAGSVDFSKYIAIGASFTAGYTDGALFKVGQENSFPATLSSKFAMIGGGNFTQPLMNDNIGGMVSGGVVQLNPRFYFNGSGPTLLQEIPTTIIGVPATGANFSNFGIPGAKSFHFIAPDYGNVAGLMTDPMTANPYFVRMNSAESTLIAEAVSKKPTFFTLSEFGGNDVLGYAISGGDGTNPITPLATFDFALGKVEEALKATGAKGVIANLPYITSLPHFTTVPYNPVPLDEVTADALNQGYAAYNGGIQGALAALKATGLFTEEEVLKRTINFTVGQGNAMVVIDESLTDLGAINPAFAALPKYRQATADDLFVLPLSSLIPQGYGTKIALEDKWVLTPQEQSEIKTAVDTFNIKLKAVADENGYALVDFNGILQKATTAGLEFDNYYMTTSLVTGGLVSLDGIHLTSRGYALMANEMLKSIDETYGSNFSKAMNGLAKADDYPTNYSPTLK